MLTKLRTTNFKAHRDTTMDLGPLTLLTGVNSSGKSSLIHALLLLRQSFLKGRLSEGLDLTEPLCRIGTGQDALYRFADSNILTISITDTEAFEFSFDAEKALNSTFLPANGLSSNVTKKLLDEKALFSNNFQYVSSLRFGGQSHFEAYDYEVGEKRQISQALGRGECVAHFLYRFGAEPSVNYLFDGNEYALADQAAVWLRRVSEGITFEVKRNPTGGFDIEYGYAYDGLKPLAGLKAENIGYGISHSLPVIVALLAAKPGALVILENPEAHLHPKGQAELAKLMSRVAQNGVQVIVETHSDHILNGVLVATKKFDSEEPMQKEEGIARSKVKIYYVDKDVQSPERALAMEVRINVGGGVEFQPKGFFDQAEKDLGYLMGF